MTDAPEEWGPWIEHGGGPNPAPGQMVAVEFRPGWQTAFRVPGGKNPDCDHSEIWSWYHDGELDDIIRYRIRKPRGLTILEELLTNLPEHERINA